MKIICPKCKKNTYKENGDHHYIESGLDNVYLQDVPIYKCSCGFSLPSIFRVGRLNELIAEALLMKPAILKPSEIMFLRKEIFLSSKDFSMIMGVGKTTVSKWENGSQQHSKTNDLHIRKSYILIKEMRHNVAEKIINYLKTIDIKKLDVEYLLVAKKVNDDYIVSYKVIFTGQTKQSDMIWAHRNVFATTGSNQISSSNLPISAGPSIRSDSSKTNFEYIQA